MRPREKVNGEKSYTAIVRIKDKQVIVHNETQTFPKKALAQAWIKRREAELQQQRATGIVSPRRVTVDEILEAYVKQAEGVTAWGRSKTADIKRLRECGLSNKDARCLTAADITEYAKHRRTVDEAGPATFLNEIIWLRQAFLTGVTLFNLSQPRLAIDAAKKDLLCTKTIAPSPSSNPGGYFNPGSGIEVQQLEEVDQDVKRIPGGSLEKRTWVKQESPHVAGSIWGRFSGLWACSPNERQALSLFALSCRLAF